MTNEYKASEADRALLPLLILQHQIRDCKSAVFGTGFGLEVDFDEIERLIAEGMENIEKLESNKGDKGE